MNPESFVEKVLENEDSISIEPACNAALSEQFTNIISPLDYFTKKDIHSVNALLILNQQINISQGLFAKLWNSSTVKICADGGINRLKVYNDKDYTPDYVIGDLDSATPENIDFYQTKGTKTILQDSQYYTDFIKSVTLINCCINHSEIIDDLSNIDTTDKLKLLEDEYYDTRGSAIQKNKNLQKINILVVGGVGGRFDQTMSTINQIWNYSQSRPHINFTIINPEHPELIMMLHPGTNLISYPRYTEEQEIEIFGSVTEKSRPGLRNVGILPLLTDATISTYGLKWDVRSWSTGITSKLSSSNLQVGQQGFIIHTDKHLFIDLEL